MICPKCGFEQDAGHGECLRCGVIFAKIRGRGHESRLDAPVSDVGIGPVRQEPAGKLAWLKQRLLAIDPDESGLSVAGRVLIFLALVVWGVRLMTHSIASNYVGESFLHLINLPFHEAGHVFFAPFGRFIQVLGGTLGQWLVPFTVLCAFVVKGNPFGGVVGLWWLGESFLDIAPYMDDARAGQLMLLGGVTGSEVADYHDWEVILTKLGWMRHDHLIARLSFGIGVALMLVSFAWGGWVLWRQVKQLRQP